MGDAVRVRNSHPLLGARGRAGTVKVGDNASRFILVVFFDGRYPAALMCTPAELELVQ